MNRFNNLQAKILKYDWLVIILLVLIGIGLRLINISAEELWYDEILGMHISYYGKDWLQIIDYGKTNFHPPLFYLIMRPWLHLLGNTEFGGRSLAVIFSSLSTYSIYYIGKKLFTKKVGLLAALFATLSPLQIEYGQEARPYAILVFLSVWSFYFFYNYLQNKDHHRSIMLVTLINIIGLYTHLDFSIVIATQFLTLLIYKAAHYAWPFLKLNYLNLKKYFIYCGILILGFLPWALYSFKDLLKGAGYGSALTVSIGLNMIFFEEDFWFTMGRDLDRLEPLLIFIGQITAIIIIIIAIKYIYRRIAEKHGLDISEQTIIMIWLWFILGTLFYFISPLSAQYTDLWQRHVVVIAPSLYFIFAYGILLIKGRYLKLLILSLFFLSSFLPTLNVLKNDSSWSWDHQNKQIFEYIEKHEGPNDLVLTPAPLFEVVALHYFKGISPVIGFLPIKGFNPLKDRNNYFLPSLEEMIFTFSIITDTVPADLETFESQIASYDRVWVYYSQSNDKLITWFLNNKKFVDCPDDFCPQLYLFSNNTSTDETIAN